MDILGKKWSIHIIRDMFRGVTRYSEFLKLNKRITTKVLSQRLKELQDTGLVEKIILNVSPVKIEYHLTEKGIALNSVILALSEFSITEFPERIFANVQISNNETELALEEAERRFSVITSISSYA